MNARVLLIMLILLASVFIFVSPASEPAYATSAVQTDKAEGSGVATLSKAFLNPVVAGHAVIAACTSLNAPITSMTDTFGTLTMAISTSSISGFGHTAIASRNATSGGADTVTCNFGAGYATDDVTLSIMEVSGVLAVASATAAGSGGSGHNISALTSVNYGYSAFLVGAYIQSNGSSWVAGGGFTLLESNPTYFGASQYKIPGSNGMTAFPIKLVSSEQWGLVGAVFPRSGTPSGNLLFRRGDGSSFSLTPYPNSYVKVSFPTSAPLYYYNVTGSSASVNLVGASLVTVWVGTSYFVSIIPDPAVTNIVYLFPPSQGVFYNLQVQDLSGSYPPGTRIYLNDTTGTTGNVRVLASGYVDSYNQFGVWAIPGAYSVTLRHGVSVFSEQINLPSETGVTIPIQILKVTSFFNCQSICTVGYAAGFNPGLTNVVGIYNDSAVLTTGVTMQLWKQNNTGTFMLSTFTTSGAFGNVQHAFSCATIYCNSTIASQLYVQFAFTDSYGTAHASVGVSGGSLFPTVPAPSTSLLGLDSILPGVTWASFFALIISFAAAGVFGALSSKFGIIPVAFIVVMFIAAGWFPGLSMAAGTFIIALAFVSFVGYLRSGR